jgi:hypothetical protein
MYQIQQLPAAKRVHQQYHHRLSHGHQEVSSNLFPFLLQPRLQNPSYLGRPEQNRLDRQE